MKKSTDNRREVISYFAFGIVTVITALATYLGIFAVAEHLLHVSMEDKTAAAYTVTYVIAQILQWLVALLVTFYTNRRWVFLEADHSKGSCLQQLLRFAGTRVATFFLDLIATYVVIHILGLWLTPANAPVLLGLKLDAELWAKVLVSALVIALNYVISKTFVFKKAA